MKMRPGKRRQSLVSVLSRRIESCELRNPDPDQLVDFLCSNYPDYNRSSRRRLLTQAIALRESSSRRSNSINSNVSDLDSAEKENGRPKRKETKGKPDADEEKLRQLETRHLMNRKRTFRWEGENEDGEEEELSTSGEWVYEQKYEPEFDLMNSQLREKYEASSKLGKGKRVKSDALEMEVVDDNTIRKDTVEFLKNGGGESGVKKAIVRKGEDGGGSGPRFKDLGGMRDVVNELKRKVIVPFYHPQLPQYLGVKPTTGILLYGPPGCGKTKLAHAIANETGVPFYKISATEVVSGVSGASEENIRELFSKAYRTAPSIVFIDEIDVIASKRENLQRDMERRIVTQLLTCMDESHRQDKSADGKTGFENSDSRHGDVLVIGATNRPDALDPALRRPGRFDREILLGVPDESARAEILSVLTCNLKVEGAFDLLKIAQATPGFVGADLVALTGTAGNLAMERIMDHREAGFEEHVDGAQADDWWKLPWSSEEMEQLSITMADFENAIGKVQPSSKREGFSAVPNVKWEEVGGLQQLRQEFESYIIRRIKFPKIYKDLGIDLETGFLLYGPPGCGKTLIAKAVANEAGANFIHIKGPELLSKYVGESELTVRTIFTRARTCAPCILFFDEVDALTTSRGKEGGEVVQRVVNQLLIELDGGEKRKDIYVIGATNRPEVMDDAILRPGRFGKRLYVPLPNAYERGLILAALAKKKPIDASVDLMAIGRDSCEKFSGADLSALMNEAAMAALEDILASEDMSRDHTQCTIKESHFKRASEKITPSVSDGCVSLPNAYERGLILAALAKKKPIDASVDLMAIGRDSCEKFSGADLSALMHEAEMAALEGLASEDMGRDHPRCTIKESHFKRASAKITPSVSDKQQQYYQSLSERWKGK